MALSKNFNHIEAEQNWYKHWLEKGYFSSTPNEKPAYTIVMPPPNVTGVLHMGHALNNTVQDVLLRFAKLKGFNTCWVPGTDHASIATEAKVVNMLKEKGIEKNNISRDEFLKYAWEWKEKYGGIILQQLKKLGCALDWNRVHFTMDNDYYDAVIDTFIDLYNKGHIYRGVKMINWDPKAKTALSDEEVNHKEVNSKLVYIKYALTENKNEFITVATVRPETILGDVAICVHPDDERYKNLVGKTCLVPLINREIPIIADDYIDIEFGTGCLKITPAHDINDFNLGQKYHLPVIDTLNEDGSMSEAAGLYIGEDRFDVRKKIVVDLEQLGHVLKIEDYKNQVGFSERTDVVIEPRLSMQWWCDVKKMAKPALDAVMEEDIKFYPSKYKNTYRHWMENIKDWCISRQLWWGQRIPAWYNENGEMQIAKTEQEAKEKFLQANLKTENLKQDEDVLDTWFSSWLWPLEVFGWNKNKNNEELNYYYPTSTLVTGPDIIFFWVARMIMAGYEYKNTKPFDKVYFTGIVRDKQGRKMSKTLGNSPDLLELIEKFGADAVRFGVLIASPAGNDLLYDDANCEQGKMFINKIWNAAKLLELFKDRKQEENNDAQILFINDWFQAQLNKVKQDVDTDLADFKLSEALKKIYSLIWDDYCSWYLEFIKPTTLEEPMNNALMQKAVFFFEELMTLLHPYLPFVTEEIFHQLKERNDGEDVFASAIDFKTEANKTDLQAGNLLKNITTQLRDARVKNGLKPKENITLYFLKNNEEELAQILFFIQKQNFVTEIIFSDDKIENSISFVVDTVSGCFTCEKEIDITMQKDSLEKELAYAKGFLVSVEKKLSNEKFVQNAKEEILAIEQKKKQDALEKIALLEESLRQL